MMKPSFLRNEEGSILIMAAFMLVFLVTICGAAIDFGRSEIIAHKAHQAVDAAALAAGSLPDGATEAERRAVLNRLFSLNFPDNYMGSDLRAADLAVTFMPNAEYARQVTVGFDSSIETYLIRLLGKKSISTSDTTTILTQATSSLDLDLVLVMDSSGSMSGSKMSAAKRAMRNLTDQLLAPANIGAHDKVRIGVIDYNTTVNRRLELSDNYNSVISAINQIRAGGMTAGGNATIAGYNMISNASPRPSDGKTGAVKIVVFLTDGMFNERNGISGIRWRYDICNSSTVDRRIYNRYTRSYLRLPIDVLPNYRGSDANPSRYSYDCTSGALLNFINSCEDMENDGIIRYTFKYGSIYGSYAGFLESALERCVDSPSSDYYFQAATGSELVAAFEGITNRIKTIRMAE